MGETETTEFKIGAILNPYTNNRDNGMRENIIISVAGFLNSHWGGALFIGVNDNGDVEGVNREYPLVNNKKPGWDKYCMFISDQ